MEDVKGGPAFVDALRASQWLQSKPVLALKTGRTGAAIEPLLLRIPETLAAPPAF